MTAYLNGQRLLQRLHGVVAGRPTQLRVADLLYGLAHQRPRALLIIIIITIIIMIITCSAASHSTSRL